MKHIGKHNDRKVVIIYRQIPSEDHMCLIAYSDVLPRMIHDEVMATIEGKVGQQENELANALHRHIMADGRNCLEALHNERFMKKVQTSQVIVTPTTNSACRLDELNTIITEMAKGEEAVKRLADIDSKSGIQTRTNPNARDLGDPMAPAAPASTLSALSDTDIAEQRLAQATQMKADATALLAEAARLEGEAAALLPTVEAVEPTANKKSTPSVTSKKNIKASNDPTKTKTAKVKEG